MLTAAQLNVDIRDNMNETAVAKATTAGRLFVSTGVNSIAERGLNTSTVDTSETTTSTTFADLATAGPTVTVTTGVNALLFYSVHLQNNTAGANSFVTPEVSGASTVAASDVHALRYESSNAGDIIRCTGHLHVGTLTSGSNTFTLKYRVDSGTGTFVRRHLTVFGL